MTTAQGVTSGDRHESKDDRFRLRTWLRLLSCSTMIEREIRSRLRDQFDTTLPRFDVLAQLDAASDDSAQGLSMTELSRRMMVTNGNLTSLVARLSREGLVKRTVSQADRRSHMVRLTPAGKRSLDEMTPAHAEWIDSILRGLSAADCARLDELLGRIKASAQTESPGGSAQ